MSLGLLAVHHGGGVGGAPVSLLKLLAALDRDEFAPRAIFTERGPVVDYAATLAIPMEVIPTGGALFYSAHARLGVRSLATFLRTFPSAVRTAQRALRREKPDLLHLNTSVLLAWAAAARRERIPVVWMVREVLGPNSILRRWQAGYILRHARQVIAISEAVVACFPVPIARVYNAVDLGDFPLSLLERRADVRRELDLAPGVPVVTMIGSVQRPKGHWLMLDALARIPTDTRLVLVAGGADRAYADSPKGRVKRLIGMPLDNLDALLREATRRGVQDRIQVTGFRRDVARMLAATDVLAFPSLEPEGFGRPLIEAMALRRPVVATDIGPSRELLGPEAGLLIPPEPGALASAITSLLADPARRERLGYAGRMRVEQSFTLEQQVEQMAWVYRRALRT
jgi:glycosyltransferase involved in cell wall biosynthesis